MTVVVLLTVGRGLGSQPSRTPSVIIFDIGNSERGLFPVVNPVLTRRHKCVNCSVVNPVVALNPRRPLLRQESCD